MKKRVLLLMGISLMTMLAVTGIAPQSAEAAPQATRVTGVISHDSKPMADAEVGVTCGAFTGTDTTDASGSYLVSFAATDCPVGSMVQIKAKKGELSGSAWGEAKEVTTKLNTAVVNTTLPEYGAIAAVVAAGAAGGVIVFARRRAQQGANL